MKSTINIVLAIFRLFLGFIGQGIKRALWLISLGILDSKDKA